MSTLSELIPSGGTQNNIEFVAQGTLANGQTVVLRSDGKVEAVVETTNSRTIGAIAAITPSSLYLSGVALGNNMVAISAKKSTSDNSIVIGTISGTSITFGNELVYRSDSSVNRIAGLAYDSVNNIITLALPSSTNLYLYGFTISGTGAGTTLSSFGATQLRSSWSFNGDLVEGFYSPQSGKMYFVYAGSSGVYYSAITYASGAGSLSYSNGTITTTNPYKFTGGLSYDPVLEELLINCTLQSNSGGYALMASVGTGLTYIAGYQYAAGGANSGSGQETGACHISGTNNHIFVWRGSASLSDYLYAQVIGWDGSTATVNNTRFTVESNAVTSATVSWNASASKAYTYSTYSANAYATGNELAVSGTTLSRPAVDVISYQVNNGANYGAFSVYSASANCSVVGFLDTSFRNRSMRVYQLAYPSSNVADFIGITNAAISSGATGEVAVKGGLSTGGNLLPYSLSFGSPAVFESTTADNIETVYDSNAQKIVAVYRDSQGYVAGAVGTVNGTSITYGSPVRATPSGSMFSPAVAYDSNAQKIVVFYRDNNNSSYGTAVVGTVSGTSISWGSAVIFAAASTNYIDATFDSNSNKVVVSYADQGNSNYGTAIVGTVSGTSISFGSEVVFESAAIDRNSITFDTNSNKAVLAYRTTVGKAVVGTVSGTSISFGSVVAFESTNNGADYISSTVDSANNKIVIAYVNNNLGKAIVGTVSGTSISFGSSVGYTGTDTTAYTSAVFDPSLNKVLVSYQNGSSSQDGVSIQGTVSGTSISFGAATTFSSGSVTWIWSVYDANAQKVVVSYMESTGNNDGTSIVVNPTNTLTIGSNYFVQDDGTLATTSSSNKAGKAISTTALNLVDPT